MEKDKTLYTKTYVDSRTGEVHEKSQFIDCAFTDDGYLFWVRKGCVRTFLDVPIPKPFTWSERGRIDALRHYILRGNQLLVYRSNGRIKPMTASEMQRIFQMSERQCKALITKMRRLHVIKPVRISGVTYYAFNPIYGVKGKRISLPVFIIFQDELRELLPPWAITRFVQQADELNPMIEVLDEKKKPKASPP